MFDVLLVITAVCMALSIIFVFLKQRYQYWEKRGVPYLKPDLIYGNMKEPILYNVPEPQHFRDVYDKFDGHKFFGYFKFQRPELFVRDPELIKLILVKDFSHFHDRNTSDIVHKGDPLSYHLFNLNGQSWKTLRVKLTPTFTSGKMKMMFHLMKECADSLDNVISECITKGSDFEMKDVIARYSTDIIGSCAFGLTINSLQNPDVEFRKMGRIMFENNFRNRIFITLFHFYPQLLRKLGFSITSKSMTKYFVSTVESTIKYRDENKVERNDFLNLLMSLRNNGQSDNDRNDDTKESPESTSSEENKLEITPTLMAAQCFVFFTAGFEISSSIVGVCLVELATNENIQEKVHQEIEEVLQENGNELTYKALNSMRYTQQVVLETMRKYPPVHSLIRTCTKTYQVPNSNFVIEKGTNIVIPTYALHHDPQYYPDPDQFNPENFSEENKYSRPSFAYLPFGEGPRICIGERFGMMQVKLALITLVRKYQFRPSPKMILPIKLAPKTFLTSIKGGIWLNCAVRQNSNF